MVTVHQITNFFKKVNSIAGFIAGLCVCVSALLIIAEIIVRSTTSHSLYVTDEYTGYLMAVSSMLGLGYVEMCHGHIRMDLIDMLKGKYPGLLRVLKYITYIAAIAVAVYLTVVSWKIFHSSYVDQTRSMQISATLLYIPQACLPIGSLLLVIQYVINLWNFAAGESDK